MDGVIAVVVDLVDAFEHNCCNRSLPPPDCSFAELWHLDDASVFRK